MIIFLLIEETGCAVNETIWLFRSSSITGIEICHALKIESLFYLVIDEDDIMMMIIALKVVEPLVNRVTEAK